MSSQKACREKGSQQTFLLSYFLSYSKHVSKYTDSNLVGDFFKLSGKVKYFSL